MHDGPNPVFELCDDAAVVPTRGSKHAVGLDLYACESVPILAGKTQIISTGLKCQFNPGWGAFLWDRSSLGLKGCHRYAGVIDPDYRGIWGVVLHNSTRDMVVIHTGDRIAQVVFQPCWVGLPAVGEVDETERMAGGFGSTGR
jgi:dUTP pyrophosphatase